MSKIGSTLEIRQTALALACCNSRELDDDCHATKCWIMTVR